MVKVSPSSGGEATYHLLASFICTSKIIKFTTRAELIHFTCDWSFTTDISDQYTTQLFIIFKNALLNIWIRLLIFHIIPYAMENMEFKLAYLKGDFTSTILYQKKISLQNGSDSGLKIALYYCFQFVLWHFPRMNYKWAPNCLILKQNRNKWFNF